MASSIDTPLILHADREHSGIRAVILLALIVFLWISFIAARLALAALFPQSDYLGLLSCLSAFPLALLLVWVLEQGLKRVWPSGRKLMLDESGIRVQAPGHGERVFVWSGNLTNLNWFFRLSGFARGGHERRVPKQWLCLACQIQQDENRVIAYTFMPMKRAAAIIQAEHPAARFNQIFPAEVYDTSFRSRIGPPTRPEIPTSVLASHDGRYWLAERRRWNEGFELAPADFETLLGHLQERRPAVSNLPP